MFNTVALSRNEKKVIRKIARKQLQSLYSILNEDTQEDIKLMLLQDQINPYHFKLSVENDIELYEEIVIAPHKVFNLDEVNLAIMKHILFNFVTHSKYNLGKKKIWRKFIVMDNFQICLQ